MRLFDLHGDTMYECYTKGWSLVKNPGHWDLRRAGRYESCGQIFAVWIPDRLRGERAWRFCRKVLRFAKIQEQKSGGFLRFFCKGDDLASLFHGSPCVGMLSVEGGAALAGDLRRIARLSDLGVKAITITWNGENELGRGCLASDKQGLTPLGKAAIPLMEAAGILPDVSHLNEAGFWDVAAAAQKPFIATHSNAAAVCSHPRNLTDAQFCEIRRRGGIVGLTLCREFLGEQTFEALERHLYHFLSLGGEQVVCLGGDWDGTPLPPDWRGIAVAERMGEYFSRKNYHTDLLEGLFFSNCYNFFRRL